MTNSQPEIVLVNPRAGSGAASRSNSKWRARLSPGSEIRYGSNAQETERLATEAAREQVPRLTIVGGDGTIHHALNGYLSVPETRTQVAIIPAGTANDYAASLREHRQTTHDRFLMVDVGMVRYPGFQRSFFNVAGIGLTAHTAISSRPAPWLPARLRYTLGLFRTLIYGWRHQPATIELPDRRLDESKLLTLSVAIGKREGSFPLAPEARMNDGQFNLLLASKLRRRDVCRYLPGLFVGRLPQKDPRIQYHQASHLRLRSPAALHLHLDGEIYGPGTLPAECDIHIEHAGQMRIELVTPE